MEKNYQKWSKIKSKIHNTTLPDSFHINPGEVWWCALGENIGIETDGKGQDYLRPVLVVKVFNKNHVWVSPLTTKTKKNRFTVEIKFFSQSSFVIISQLRTISTLRLTRFIYKIDHRDFLRVNESLMESLKYETPP